jgi:hypothetical protein
MSRGYAVNRTRDKIMSRTAPHDLLLHCLRKEADASGLRGFFYRNFAVPLVRWKNKQNQSA